MIDIQGDLNILDAVNMVLQEIAPEKVAMQSALIMVKNNLKNYAAQLEESERINLELAEFMFDYTTDGSDIDGSDAQNKLESLGFIELVEDPESSEPVWEWVKGSQVSTINKLLLKVGKLQDMVKKLAKGNTIDLNTLEDL